MSPELFDRLAPVGSLGDERHVGLVGDQTGDALPQQRMIVHRENANSGVFWLMNRA
jgi:hypothetical protein